jgi:hypothetical protein
MSKPSETDIKNLVSAINKKYILSDYDLGVLATLKWVLGSPHPYDGRVE